MVDRAMMQGRHIFANDRWQGTHSCLLSPCNYISRPMVVSCEAKVAMQLCPGNEFGLAMLLLANKLYNYFEFNLHIILKGTYLGAYVYQGSW